MRKIYNDPEFREVVALLVSILAGLLYVAGLLYLVLR